MGQCGQRINPIEAKPMCERKDKVVPATGIKPCIQRANITTALWSQTSSFIYPRLVTHHPTPVLREISVTTEHLKCFIVAELSSPRDNEAMLNLSQNFGH